jgi:hypothetical protein
MWNLNLTTEEVQLIIAALCELPYKSSAAVIADIQRQIDEHINQNNAEVNMNATVEEENDSGN